MFFLHLVKLSPEMISSSQDLEGFEKEKSYPVIAIDLEKEEIEIEEKKESSKDPEKQKINELSEDEEDEEINYRTITRTKVWFLLANEKTKKYKWFNINQLFFENIKFLT